MYAPLVAVIEVPQMRHYHEKTISCQKGAECNTRQKWRRWVVLDVRPIVAIFC